MIRMKTSIMRTWNTLANVRFCLLDLHKCSTTFVIMKTLVDQKISMQTLMENRVWEIAKRANK